MPVVQFAAPHGSLSGTQEAMRPPWLAVAPKKAVRAATADQAPLVTTVEERRAFGVQQAEFRVEPIVQYCPEESPGDN